MGSRELDITLERGCDAILDVLDGPFSYSYKVKI